MVLLDLGLKAVMMAISPIALLVGFVASYFVTMGGALTNWALDLNSQVINSPTVQIGWVVSRDLANLGFVLVIILIAFATILRFESYGMKKLLWKLIAAALLVNFSLVIAGVFLDFSGVLTNFFIDKATSYDGAKLGAGLANAFKVHSVVFPTEDANVIKTQVQGMNEDFNQFVNFITSQIFVAIFTVIVAMSLISLAAMLYVRYIALTILLILAPLAWLFWIWPELEEYHKKWWGGFMRWTFFAPAVTFFIYLALAVALQFKNNPASAPVLTDLNATGLLIKEWGTALGQMISILGILYGGLYVANQMGIAGASAGFAVAGGVRRALTGAALLGGGMAATGAGRLYYKLRGETLGQTLRTKTAEYSAKPVIGGLMLNANRALVGRTEKRLEQFKEKYKGADKDAILNTIKRDPFLMSEEERAGLMEAVADKDLMRTITDPEKGLIKEGKMTQEHYESFVRSALKMGGSARKAVLAKDPTLAGLEIAGATMGNISTEAGRTARKIYYDNPKAKEAIVKAFAFMKPEAIDDLDIDSLRYPEFLGKLKGSHLRRLLDRSGEDVEKFIGHVEENLKNISAAAEKDRTDIISIARRISENPAWRGTRRISPEVLKSVNIKVRRPRETAEEE